MQKLKILLQSKIFLLFSVIFIIFYVILFTKIIHFNSVYPIDTKELEGVIIDKKIDGDKFSFVLKAKEKVQATYYFKNEEEKNKYINTDILGKKVKVIGNLSKPKRNTIPNTFNYARYLYNHNIYLLLNAQEIEIQENKPAFFYQIKNSFIRKINKYDKTEGYLYAFILGDSGYIDSDVYTTLKNNGVTHLFAISGMHIGFFTLAIQKFLEKFHISENKINVFTILFLTFYLFLVGFTASVVRASLFYVILLFNKKYKLGFKNSILLYYLFFFLLILNPFYIYDIGFVYSFITSFGLILFSKNITGNYFLKFFKTSLFAFLFSLPITLFYYYEFNLLTIINNLIIVPIVSLVLFPLSLLTFLFSFLNPILNWGFLLLEELSKILDSMAVFVVVGKISIFFIIFYYIVLFLIYRYSFKLAPLFLLPFVFHYVILHIDNNSYVYYLDVGQGDAELIIGEHKRDVILIDSGGKIEYEKEPWQVRNSKYNLSDNIIGFLKSMGISKISSFVITHGDFDHMGEALNLVNNFSVEEVIFNVGEYNLLEQKLIKELDNKNIKYYKGLNELNTDKYKLQFLNTREYDNENDNSNVVYLELDGYKFLFMGDAGVTKERDILNSYNIVNIDFLKVGHHGSNTSSSKEFINKINPKYSLISVGANNRYGHPKNEVLETLKKSKIYRTDTHGSIEIKLNQRKYNIKIYAP